MSKVKFGFSASQLIAENRTTKEDIELLKSFLSTQNLPKLTDEQVALFLLACRNKQEPAKAAISAFYSIREDYPELFRNRTFLAEDLQLQLKTIRICLLPERTEDGCAIIYCGLQDSNYSNFEMAPALKLLFMTLDAALIDYPPKALYILFDMKGAGLMHLTKLRMGLIKVYFRYLQEALPLQLKKMHVLNTVSFLDKVLLLIKPFVKKNVLEMAYFHPSNMDWELFHTDYLPKRCLPEEMGGDLASISVLYQTTLEKLKSMESYFEAEERQRLEMV